MDIYIPVPNEDILGWVSIFAFLAIFITVVIEMRTEKALGTGSWLTFIFFISSLLLSIKAVAA